MRKEYLAILKLPKPKVVLPVIEAIILLQSKHAKHNLMCINNSAWFVIYHTPHIWHIVLAHKIANIYHAIVVSYTQIEMLAKSLHPSASSSMNKRMPWLWTHQVLISHFSPSAHFHFTTTAVIFKKLEEIKWAQNVRRFVRNRRKSNGKPKGHV